MTEAFAVFFSIFLGMNPTAQHQKQPCPTTPDIVVNRVQYYHGSFSSGECWLSYSKALSRTMNYRSVLFTDSGSIMVFNSFDGSQGVDHGARVFYTFPRNLAPDFVEKKDGVVIKTATKGFELFVDAQAKQITKSKHSVVTEDSTVEPANRGGIEILKHKFLIMDAGWMNHNDPTAMPKRHSTFIDKKGRTCVVQNSEVFFVDKEGEHHFKFTDQELNGFLKTRCPDLKGI